MMTTGEGMSNAGNSIMALWNLPGSDLRKTYFVTGGVAGGNPKVISSGSVAFARFTVQPTLEFEIDAREIPAAFSSGYFPQGGRRPSDAWGTDVYNTEVFAVNAALRDLALAMVDVRRLADSAAARAYRLRYRGDGGGVYAAGAAGPRLVPCDLASSDTWFSGALLGDAFAARSDAWTNGSARYCATAQEDGAVAAALVRGAGAGRVDFNRLVLMRSSKWVAWRRHDGGEAGLTPCN